MKLIVSDLDGTILNNESDVSEKTIQVIKKLVRETDIEFAIATGRGYASTKRIKMDWKKFILFAIMVLMFLIKMRT